MVDTYITDEDLTAFLDGEVLELEADRIVAALAS
ncbi:MAG: hypothetical protein ACI861_001349, partial [Paracoccaceae bacterium]